MKKLSPIKSKSQIQSNEKQSINIYAGTNENANLSNFAIRPFLIDGEEFKSVEQYFQYVKDYVIDDITEEQFWHNHKIALQILNTTDGAELRRLGKQFQALDVSRWDKASTIEMKKAITASFEDNPDSLQQLLNTGNSILTHNQDKSKWGTEFPRILMEVRNKFLANMNKSKSQSKLETASTKLSGLDLVDRYVAAEKQLREELTQLGLSEADITTKFNEFATILRNNNINTKDAIFEALRKYICNL